MVPRSTIHKQKRKNFHLSSILLYLLPFSPIFPKTTPRCLKSSNGRYKEGTKKKKISSIKQATQKVKKVTKVKTREKVKKWRLIEKKDKRKWLEYLKQLQNKVFAKNSILLESTEAS